MEHTTNLKQAATRTGRFGHFTVDGVTTLCGRNDVARIIPNFVRDGHEFPPVADCRNCNHKALGTRRTR